MRVVCPSCAAAYEVPEPMLGARARTLRCGRCATEWVLPAPEPEPEPEIAAEAFPAEPDEPEPVAEPPEPLPHPFPGAVVAAEAESSGEAVATLSIPERQRPFVRAEERPAARAERRAGGRGAGNGAAWLGWVASLVLLGLLVWGGYTYRDVVMHVWPPSERLYALLGLMPVPRP